MLVVVVVAIVVAFVLSVVLPALAVRNGVREKKNGRGGKRGGMSRAVQSSWKLTIRNRSEFRFTVMVTVFFRKACPKEVQFVVDKEKAKMLRVPCNNVGISIRATSDGGFGSVATYHGREWRCATEPPTVEIRATRDDETGELSHANSVRISATSALGGIIKSQEEMDELQQWEQQENDYANETSGIDPGVEFDKSQ